MSENAIENGGEQIIAAILAEADARAKDILDNATRVANAQTDKAQRQAEQERAGILAEAEIKRAKIHEREIASGKIEAKRILLAAREELTTHLLAQLDQSLSAIRQDVDQYEQSLSRLASEAVRALGQTDVVLRLSKADARFVDASFAERLAKDVSGETRCAINIAIQLEERDLGGGCIAQSQDGRVIYDNTYPKRMERRRKDLRAKVVKELVQDHD